MYEYDSRVRLSEVDQHQRMTLNAVLNYFQDCSSFHSEDLGVGIEYLNEHNRMWVLRSWKIVVDRYPYMGEQIKVGTWPYEFGRMTGRRNFRLLDNQGKMAAYADSEWVLMDTERMRPTKIEESLSGAYTLEPGLDMGSEEGKISLPEQMESRDAFEVHEYHLDVNRHVNNGQYVQMAADYLPEETKIHEMRAEYKRSAVLGNQICPLIGKRENTWIVSLNDETGMPYAVIEFK